ncbi:hypothetical protein [Streptomyces sp. H51]|uniref:hypothetical protein n=1 Tax=Streptomyces sp. H51 TaxID=3111770 RepID=UPI002D77D351|nr:hypothetical protein [Streptomyces sp. H51]
MTRDRARKQEIRARMAETGEPYSEARRQLTAEITAYCQQCGQEVAPGEGELSLSSGEHKKAQEAREAFERGRRERIAAAEPNDFEAHSINPRDIPPRAQWVVHHYRCRPAEHWDGYGLEVGRLRTYRELVGVIIHLSDKGHFEHTDLRTVLAEMHYAEPWGADEQKRRFRSVRPAEL